MIDKKEAKKSKVNVIDSSEVITDSQKEIIEKIKSLLPNVVNSDNQLDTKALNDLVNIANTTSNNQGYELTFAGKGIARALADKPTDKELKVDLKQSKNFEDTENVIIRGDNIDALKILYQNYHNSIKMIYIDPPYNTKNEEFVYNDNFKKSEEELIEEFGLGDETVNFLDNVYGTRSHSGWLSFMYPRLKIARELLKDDGVIFISIDDNEVAQLRILMDEIFGEDNFRNQIAVKRGAKSVQSQFENIDKLGIAYEVILVYSKKSDVRLPKFYFDLENEKDGGWNNHWRGTDRPTMRYEILGCNINEGQWRWSKIRSEQAVKNFESLLKDLKTNNPSQAEIDIWYQLNDEVDLLRISATGKPEHYIPSTDKKFGHNLWTDLLVGKTASLKALNLNYFDNPKNPNLIIRIAKWITDTNDIILDFFAGSGTTADAVMQLNAEDEGNRKFILVQLDEKAKKKEAIDFCKENKFEPVISSICIERVNRAGDKILKEKKDADGMFKDENKLDIGYKVFSLKDKTKVNFDADKKLFKIDNERTSHLDTLYNMLAATTKPLDTPIEEIKKGAIYKAENELYILKNVKKEDIEKFKDLKINIDAFADFDLQNYLNMGVSKKSNVTVVY